MFENTVHANKNSHQEPVLTSTKAPGYPKKSEEPKNTVGINLRVSVVAFGDAPASCESQTVEELYQSNLHADKAVPIGKGMPGKLVGFPGWLMQIVD